MDPDQDLQPSADSFQVLQGVSFLLETFPTFERVQLFRVGAF